MAFNSMFVKNYNSDKQIIISELNTNRSFKDFMFNNYNGQIINGNKGDFAKIMIDSVNSIQKILKDANDNFRFELRCSYINYQKISDISLAITDLYNFYVENLNNDDAFEGLSYVVEY